MTTTALNMEAFWNPYGNPFGTGIFGPPPNLQTRAANQPYGSTVNTPTADVAQPNAAQQKNNQTTARILAQQQRENIFERGWHDMERGLSSAGHDLEAHWEADKAFMEFELSPGKREAATLSNAFAAEISDPGAQRTAAEALFFGTDGMDDNFGPELATSGNSFGNDFANPLRQPLWKSNPSLMFREERGGDESNWASPDESLGKISESQAKNLGRFLDKIPRNSENIRVKDFLNGGKVFQADSPASNISGSYARYEKQVDEFGSTVLFTKSTFGPNDEIIHIAQKFPPAGKFYPEAELENLLKPDFGGW